ncbi:DUF4192 domain-containing protein [Gordonia paraffinivorans]|uniref:DUF4192 domain-containing protein n=1 Tax=Gordonia paraffinivorans TaxID=175628 RepID=UPI0021B4BA67|nr:DUF4192 domain-containing protein [Gordonia paraffinivorans]
MRTITHANLIAAIPGMLGFVPADSILVIGVNGDKIAMTARHDISGVDGMAAYLAAVMQTHSVPTAVVIAITEDENIGTAAVRTMSNALMRHGIETDRRLVVARCDQPAPYRDLITGDTGTSGDYRESPVSANRILTGQPVAQSREAMRESLATTDPIDSTNVELQPELAAKAIVSAIVNWPTEIPGLAFRLLEGEPTVAPLLVDQFGERESACLVIRRLPLQLFGRVEFERAVVVHDSGRDDLAGPTRLIREGISPAGRVRRGRHLGAVRRRHPVPRCRRGGRRCEDRCHSQRGSNGGHANGISIHTKSCLHIHFG